MNDHRRPLRVLPPRALLLLLLSLTFLAGSPAPEAQSLLGSRASLLKQNEEAREHEFSYLQTASEVQDFAQRGILVTVSDNADFWVADVSFPYARPEVKTFLERIAGQYHHACGEQLVVTSLTRPTSRQPRNASPLSVHPTGMAADLRRSSRPACRAWLEKNLLALEGDGVIEATKENHPPHYHVTVFPKPYLQYLASRGESPDVETAAAAATEEVRLAKADPEPDVRPVRSSHHGRHSRLASRSSRSSHHSRHPRIAQARNRSGKKYRVGRGDTLWTIAQRHRVSVAAVKKANRRLHTNRLKPGQMLAIPAG